MIKSESELQRLVTSRPIRIKGCRPVDCRCISTFVDLSDASEFEVVTDRIDNSANLEALDNIRRLLHNKIYRNSEGEANVTLNESEDEAECYLIDIQQIVLAVTAGFSQGLYRWLIPSFREEVEEVRL